MGQPSSLHVHRTVAILISKIKQEKNKQKRNLLIKVVVLAVTWPSSLMVAM